MGCGCVGGACGGPACGWAGVVYAGTGVERCRHGFGQEDEMVSRWRCDRWWAFLGRAETSRVGGGVPSRGCRGGAVGVPRGRRGPPGMRTQPGKVESTRRARSIRSCGAFSSTSPAPFGISRDGIARGDDRAPFIGCYQGSVEGIGWMRGWNGAHLDRQRVAKSGDWEVASAIIVQHQAASPSSGSAPPLVVAARVGNAVPYSNESGV